MNDYITIALLLVAAVGIFGFRRNKQNGKMP